MYSLSIKAGWKGTITGLDGIGWIALAITIFGGWNPVKVALGAYLFAFLQWLGLVLQSALPGVPSQVLQVAPFPLMILTLLFVNMGNAEWVSVTLARLPERPRRALAKFLRAINAKPPAALGAPFEKD
jgi:simple sugar transport system permease protein